MYLKIGTHDLCVCVSPAGCFDRIFISGRFHVERWLVYFIYRTVEPDIIHRIEVL